MTSLSSTFVLLGLVVLARKRGLLGGNTEESRAMGFWIGIGVAVGAGLGAVFGLIVFDNPGIFPVFIGAGGAVGVARRRAERGLFVRQPGGGWHGLCLLWRRGPRHRVGDV